MTGILAKLDSHGGRYWRVEGGLIDSLLSEPGGAWG
jgi:hypothetical protein